MHRWIVRVAVRSRRERLSPAVVKLLLAELEHLEVKVTIEPTPSVIEVRVLAIDAPEAVGYATRRLAQVLLPVWKSDLSFDLVEVSADLRSQ